MRSIGRLLVLAAGLGLPLAMSSSCGSGGIVGGDCSAGLKNCGGQCVNVGSDPLNCGSCGTRCEAGQECLVGVCIGTPVVVDNLDGGVTLPDGAILLPDGAVVRPDGASLGGGGGSGGGGSGGAGAGSGSGGADAGGSVCEAPFNTGEACGDCSTSCSSPYPLCAPSSAGFECVSGCDEGLLACGNRCINPLIDADHCGRCDRRCPTAICRNGECVGGTAGHVVSMCMNLELFRSNAPQNVLLGNSVFLAPSDPVRVLGYHEHASARGLTGVRRALTDADQANGRTLELELTDRPDAIATALRVISHDVVLIYDQALAPSGDLAVLGQSWADPLRSFVAAGGVVITLASATGTQEMTAFLDESGLANGLTGVRDVTGELLYNRSFSDSVGLNVFNEFLALSSSCTFDAAASPAPGTSFVVTDTPGTQGDPLGSPTVIHRVVAFGG